jgi:hypothetical protein
MGKCMAAVYLGHHELSQMLGGATEMAEALTRSAAGEMA